MLESTGKQAFLLEAVIMIPRLCEAIITKIHVLWEAGLANIMRPGKYQGKNINVFVIVLCCCVFVPILYALNLHYKTYYENLL